MESNITVNAKSAEMDRFFENNGVCSVRYFEPNGNGKYKVTIRHNERESRLSGTFTIPQIIAELSEDKDKAVVWWKYTMYLHDWAASHTEADFYGMTPACFDEWLNTEHKEKQYD